MSTLSTEISEDEKVADLARQIVRLDREVRSIRILLAQQGLTSLSTDSLGSTESAAHGDQLQALLHSAGLLSDGNEEWAQQRAKKWDDMPAEEKEQFILEFQSLDLSPPLSEIVIQNRR
jgi:hypothetical protein